MADGQYKFSIRLDNKLLEMDITQAKKAFADLVKQAKAAGSQVGDIPNPFEQIGKSVPKATRQFNGLNTATQQLVRELPAATMGLNTFFLAISNNLPIFTDQIKAASQANKDLVAQGKPTTSVFKQIIGSLVSWQSFLVLGVTALSMYGKEIGKWVALLFKSKKALDEVAQAEKALHEVRLKGTVDAQEEVTKIRLTVQAAQDATASIEERTNAIRTLKEEYPEYFANLSNEQIMYGDLTDTVEKLVTKTIELLRARNAFNQLVENEQNLQLLQGMDSYAEFESANAAYEARGRKEREMQLSGGQYRLGVTKQYLAWDKAQKALLKDLKNGGEEAAKLLELIEDKYDGDVDAFIKATQASNTKLGKEAQKIIADGANAAAEAAKRAAELRAEQIANTSERLIKDAYKAKNQAEIDAMAEGIQKKIKQINLDYELEEQTIAKREKEMLDMRGGMLTMGEAQAIEAMRKANKSKRDRDISAAYDAVFADAEEWLKEATEEEAAFAEELTETLTEGYTKRLKAYEDYYISYGTLKEKILGTTQRYNRLIAEAENEAERKSLMAERDAILAEYQMEASSWAQELVDKTTTQLNKMLAELQAEVEAKQDAFDALGASDSEDAQKYREEINRLNAQIKALQKELGKASRTAGDKKWDESVQIFQNIAESATEAADGIAKFDEGLGSSLRAIANLASSGLNLVVVIKKITEAAWTGATAISAMEKASLILAAISAAIQVVAVLFDLFKQNDEVENTKKAFAELNDELVRLHKLARIDSVEGTIFGSNPFGNFINNLKAMQDALKDFEASKEAIRSKDAQYMDVVAGWNADGSAVIQKVPQGRQNLNDAISNMRVKTKDRNWFGETFLGGDEYDDLGDLVPELFDEFGNVTLEGLQNLQNSDVWKDLGEKDRELIEQMIDDWEDYNAAVEATNKYLSGVFGDLGYTMTNALVDAFEDGTDAAQAFGEAASDVIEKLSTDMIHAALVQPILDKYQQLVDEANLEEMSPEERIAELTRLIGQMSQEVLAVKDEVDATASQVRQDAEDAGITGVYDGSSSSSATSKGFQTMSQETGSELNGRFTDIQGQTHRIAEAVEFNKSIQQQQTLYLQSVSETLAAIHTNTDSIERHTRALANIESDISAMRRTMDNGGGI